MFNFNQNNLKNANLFAAGLALGTVGLKVLTSKDAKKVYAGIVAAGLRAKETVLETAEKVQASASDVLAEACLLYTSCRCRRYSLCRSRWSPYH